MSVWTRLVYPKWQTSQTLTGLVRLQHLRCQDYVEEIIKLRYMFRHQQLGVVRLQYLASVNSYNKETGRLLPPLLQERSLQKHLITVI